MNNTVFDIFSLSNFFPCWISHSFLAFLFPYLIIFFFFLPFLLVYFRILISLLGIFFYLSLPCLSFYSFISFIFFIFFHFFLVYFYFFYSLSNLWMSLADRYSPNSIEALNAADRHDSAMLRRKNGKIDIIIFLPFLLVLLDDNSLVLKIGKKCKFMKISARYK